jgi:hypothetical protein
MPRVPMTTVNLLSGYNVPQNGKSLKDQFSVSSINIFLFIRYDNM